jgi:exosortase
LLVWVAGFAFCFGARALRRGIFPSALLLLMIPLPDLLLRELIRSLQMGTADVSEALFRLTGVAFLRSGMDFELPGFIVEIAEECSGIRSSMALLITNLIAGHLFLRSTWSKLALTLVTAPLLIVKNAIRIVTLSLLSVHVDPGFLTGNLHRSGGAVFFLIALILLGAALISLQKVERTYGGRLHA